MGITAIKSINQIRIFTVAMSGYCVNDDVTDCWILKTGISLIVNFMGRLTGK